MRLEFLENRDHVCLVVPHLVLNLGLAHSRSSRNMCWMEGGRKRRKEGGAEGQRERERRVGGKAALIPFHGTIPISHAIPPPMPLLTPRPGPYTRAST